MGIGLAAQRLNLPPPNIDVAIRTGDTSAADRRDINRTPPDILITTPESLYLLLTSRAEEILASVRWVIVDEIHSVAGTKRGAHLALSLERLDHVAQQPVQRIGLSATQRPLDEIGRFLGGADRPVTLVDVGKRKALDLQVIVPIEDMANPGLDAQALSVPGGSVLPINPRTGKPGKIIPVQDVYNLYFTPDGTYAWVVAEAYKRLDFYDPKTWKRVRSASFPRF